MNVSVGAAWPVGALPAQVLLVSGRLPVPAGQGRVPVQFKRRAVSEAPDRVVSGRGG